MLLLLKLLTLHFIGDFLLQSDWMATNKSKNWFALYVHAGVYSVCFAAYGFWFAMGIFCLHFLTDALTSRWTSKLWVANQRHWFFVVIGLDQLIHAWTLAGTAYWLGVQ